MRRLIYLVPALLLAASVVIACGDDLTTSGAYTPTPYTSTARKVGEGEYCSSGYTECEAGLSCSGSTCVVPGKVYQRCSAYYCSQGAQPSPSERCTCDAPGGSPSSSSLAAYSAKCGPPENPRTQTTCCGGTDGSCSCEFSVWKCSDGASYCSCDWTGDNGQPATSETCAKGATRTHCCVRDRGSYKTLGDTCTCSSSACTGDEREVDTCGTSFVVPDRVAPPGCNDGQTPKVTCRGSGQITCEVPPPPAPTPTNTSSASSTGGSSTSSSGSSTSSSGSSTPSCNSRDCSSSGTSCSEGFCISCYFFCSGNKCESRCSD